MTDPDQSRQAKRMKTTPQAPNLSEMSASEYTYSPSNLFNRMLEKGVQVEFLFNRPHSFAILDKFPVSKGHALLVIKAAAATLLEEIPADVMAAAMADLQVLCRAVSAATGCAGLQVHQNNGPAAGQTVPQLHFHVVPRYRGEELPHGGERKELSAEDAGPIIAKIRNTLPAGYSPACHVWIPNSEAMEGLGRSLQHALGQPGMVILLEGHLGAGKSTIARGFVRAFCKDAMLDVPSPTFLLCLSYQEDLGHDPAARQDAAATMEVHHMDPYRLGAKADKMAGLIDFEAAFRKDVCLIEWPDRMPAEVMKLPCTGVRVQISGTGIQAAGRHVSITSLHPEDPEDRATQVLAQWRTAGPPEAAVPWKHNGTAGGQPLQSTAAQPLGLPVEQWVVLGIESSCDDTAAAVVRGDGTVLAHKIASQAGLHEQYGGVKPDVARDAHAQAIHDTVNGCLADAGVSAAQLTAVAVTVGPGLSLCLQVGVRHALQLAAAHQLLVVPVHHMEAHALMTRMPGVNAAPMQFPALLLLVSGGHNMLVLCEGIGRHRIVGTTLDDSVGECFDKIARILDISAIPGGPHLEKLAEAGDKQRFKLPIPMQTGVMKDSCNFSFSGLKTAVVKVVETEKAQLSERYAACEPASTSDDSRQQYESELAQLAQRYKDREGAAPADVLRQQYEVEMAELSQRYASSGAASTREASRQQYEAELQRLRSDVAASFQHVAVLCLQQRTRRALQWLREESQQEGTTGLTCLVVAGGVAANRAVRAGLEAVAAEMQLPCICPPVRYCTDNGLMVAWTGIERLRLGLYEQPPANQQAAENNINVLPRWPMGPMDPRSQAKGQATIKMFH